MPLSANTRSQWFKRLTKTYRAVSFWIFVRPTQVFFLIRHKELYKRPSYYPELGAKRKSPRRIFCEQLGQIWKYGRVNQFYFLYGFDVKSRAQMKEYVHNTPFIQRRGDLNLGSLYVNSSILLRDKFYFSIFADGIGIKTARIRYYTTEGILYDYGTKKPVGISALTALPNQRLFCKPLDGECGRGIFVLRIEDGQFFIEDRHTDSNTLLGYLNQGRYLVQEFITQHSEMSRLHPQSVNCIRLVTVRSLKDKEIHVMPSILRIGAGGSVVDNTSQGGVAVGIDLKTGYLKEYGFFKPQFGLKAVEHPDSHIRFADFQIPHFDEVKRQACYFHSMLPDIHSIGWDIAVGEDGPIFVEGNDNWEPNGPQSCNGGIASLVKEYFYL